MEVKNPSINRPLGLALWSKIKSNIGANAFVDFSSLLGLKNKNKSFEITENLGECKIKPIKQTNEISAITQCVQDIFFFCWNLYRKVPTESPSFKRIWGYRTKTRERGRGGGRNIL